MKIFCPDWKETYNYKYPFNINFNAVINVSCTEDNNFITDEITVTGNFSSDATFYVTTGVLAMLYTLAVIFVYAKFDNEYKTKDNLPIIVSSLYNNFIFIYCNS